MFTWVNSGKSSLSMHHPGNGTLWPTSLPISTAGSSFQQSNQSSYPEYTVLPESSEIRFFSVDFHLFSVAEDSALSFAVVLFPSLM